MPKGRSGRVLIREGKGREGQPRNNSATLGQDPGSTPDTHSVGGGLVVKLCPTLETPWAGAHQAPLSMGFSRQKYWSGLPFPSPGILPYPKIEPWSPALPADSVPSEPLGKPILHMYMV